MTPTLDGWEDVPKSPLPSLNPPYDVRIIDDPPPREVYVTPDTAPSATPTAPPAPTPTLLDAGPDGAFVTNLQAYHALKVLQAPDGEHNRAQRRKLAKEIRHRLGRATVREFDALYAKSAMR